MKKTNGLRYFTLILIFVVMSILNYSEHGYSFSTGLCVGGGIMMLLVSLDLLFSEIN